MQQTVFQSNPNYEDIERYYQSDMLNQRGIYGTCDNCRAVTHLTNIWEIYRG